MAGQNANPQPSSRIPVHSLWPPHPRPYVALHLSAPSPPPLSLRSVLLLAALSETRSPMLPPGDLWVPFPAHRAWLSSSFPDTGVDVWGLQVWVPLPTAHSGGQACGVCVSLPHHMRLFQHSGVKGH